MSNLVAFDRKLRIVAKLPPPASIAVRPFLCDGSPFGCEVFLVGINPGTDIPLWPYWSHEGGCDKAAWLQAYLERHGRFRPTRARIERICTAMGPVRALETNVFHARSRREAGLAKNERTTEVFDFLLDELKPRVLFVHGRSGIEHLQRRTGALLAPGTSTRVRYQGIIFDVIARHHLSYQCSYAEADQIGCALRDRLR